MGYCLVTGAVVNRSGTPIPSAVIEFYPRLFRPEVVDGQTIPPGLFRTVADATGEVQFTIAAGNYHLRTVTLGNRIGNSIEVTIPDVADADLSQIILSSYENETAPDTGTGAGAARW